jgi:predicted acylesterase/phospholipase RssA
MVDYNAPGKQRALILQGGGALGAYEAGAFKALCMKIPAIDAKNHEANRPLFDIVAGTSIGAINAAILISNFKEDDNRSWNSASQKLQDFWNYISSDSPEMLNLELIGGMKYTNMIKMLLHLKLLGDTILQSTSCRMELIECFLSLN